MYYEIGNEKNSNNLQYVNKHVRIKKRDTSSKLKMSFISRYCVKMRKKHVVLKQKLDLIQSLARSLNYRFLGNIIRI